MVFTQPTHHMDDVNDDVIVDNEDNAHDLVNGVASNSEVDTGNGIPYVDDTGDTYVLVELKPFVNQVGGHTCVLEVDKRTICKPYVPREVWFYENVPDAMKEFTPCFYGEIDVKYDVVNGKRILLACIPTHLVTERMLLRHNSDVTRKHGSKRGKKRSHGSTDRSNQTCEGCSTNRENEAEYNRTTPSTSDGCRLRPDVTDYNRWSLQCLERQITRYGFWANNQPQKFIMMGNLVSEYKYPCMMDLKMGRRQYGDDSSEEKRKLLENRCAKSTSGTLGFRICGTQVYQCASDNYAIHDKYFGRYLDIEGVANELMFFFHNGLFLRRDVIALVIRKLEKLQVILQTEKKLNLYSCSLLLIYDGYVSRDQPDVTCNIATENELGQMNNDVRNLGRTSTATQHEVGVVYPEATSDRDSGYPIASQLSTDTLFDVRLIDFAHVSEKTDELSCNEAEESNILFGLSKLIGILQDLMHNT